MARKVKVMTLDNKPMLDEVKPDEVHPKFNPVKKVSEPKGKLQIKDGRIYITISNGVGKYTDTGEVFKI